MIVYETINLILKVQKSRFGKISGNHPPVLVYQEKIKPFFLRKCVHPCHRVINTEKTVPHLSNEYICNDKSEKWKGRQAR